MSTLEMEITTRVLDDNLIRPTFSND